MTFIVRPLKVGLELFFLICFDVERLYRQTITAETFSLFKKLIIVLLNLSFPTDVELPISLKDNSHVTQMSHHTNGVMVYVAYTMLNDSFDSHKAQFIIEDGALLDINDVFVMMGTESGQAFELSRYESDELYQTGPYAFELQNVYPNPFNPSTEVSFSLPQDGHVRLSVYNIMGQEVDMIFEGFQSYGEHSYRWNANTFPSGIYYIRLATENRVTSTKAMLMK